MGRRPRGKRGAEATTLRKLHAIARDRQHAWNAGDQDAAQALTQQMAPLFERLHAVHAVMEKGSEFVRPPGKDGADDIIAARPNRKRKGEVLPVALDKARPGTTTGKWLRSLS